jgi:hypothetical protein
MSPEGLREILRKNIVNRFNFESLTLGACPICTLDFTSNETMLQLPCHATHVIHETCFIELREFNINAEKRTLCPTCRVEVDLTKLAFSEKPSAQAQKEK